MALHLLKLGCKCLSFFDFLCNDFQKVAEAERLQPIRVDSADYVLLNTARSFCLPFARSFFTINICSFSHWIWENMQGDFFGVSFLTIVCRFNSCMPVSLCEISLNTVSFLLLKEKKCFDFIWFGESVCVWLCVGACVCLACSSCFCKRLRWAQVRLRLSGRGLAS